jgi:transcriptional regulator with XRE-family HTH domain
MLVDVSIGKKIKDRREDKKISQNELARLLGISAAAVCQWERNGTVPRAKTLSKIARALGVSEQYLTGENRAAQPEEPATDTIAAQLGRLKAKVAQAMGVDADRVCIEITISN